MHFRWDEEIEDGTVARAFETQHPVLAARIPTWRNRRGFSFREAYVVRWEIED